jgi:hypothetical protein|tara:strand:- start:604 stop:1167 length:564 start_codon:yes stop_codon:yes gene_type:complete
MYKLFTDKAELFECDINLTGASYTKTKARLVVETPDFSLMFDGSVGSSGECKVPIKKLKGLIDESISGKIRLEVIAEDTYFIPWESEFEVEQSKKVTVEVKSQNKKSLVESSGPKVNVSKVKEITLSEKQHVLNIMKLLIKENINIKNLTIKRNKLNNIIAEYVEKNPINKTGEVIDKVVKVLSKRK